ncbi:MAG: nucleoside hydrolase [SAR116 cluster bacterium]|nr:MAG: nucleoside hydrolase [SAR116 cluster bacterium]
MTIPVILDTDIGFDVDDIWALSFLLKCPELDVRLITVCSGEVRYRAALVAKFLTLAGRTDIPVGLGISTKPNPQTHANWLGDYDLDNYPGRVYEDGVGALCDTIMLHQDAVRLVCIGPLTNIAAALQTNPDIVNHARVVGMHGSIKRGYLGAPKPMREFNVVQDIAACQAVFKAAWPKLITPLDTCGTTVLSGENFQRIATSPLETNKAIMVNHYDWFAKIAEWKRMNSLAEHLDVNKQSSVLYDCVAVYLAFASDWATIERLNIEVNDAGETVVSDQGNAIDCATEWVDEDAFLKFLSQRLAS